jgi:hypothetical protein
MDGCGPFWCPERKFGIFVESAKSKFVLNKVRQSLCAEHWSDYNWLCEILYAVDST